MSWSQSCKLIKGIAKDYVKNNKDKIVDVDMIIQWAKFGYMLGSKTK